MRETVEEFLKRGGKIDKLENFDGVTAKIFKKTLDKNLTETKRLIKLTKDPLKFYKSEEWEELVIKIKKRGNNSCSYCKRDGKKIKLKVEYIESIEIYPENAFNLDNLKLICKDCFDKGLLGKENDDILNKNFYRSKKWKDFRNKILKENNYTCNKCGKTRAKDCVWININHIKNVKEFPEKAFNLDNLDILCDNCKKSENK